MIYESFLEEYLLESKEYIENDKVMGDHLNGFATRQHELIMLQKTEIERLNHIIKGMTLINKIDYTMSRKKLPFEHSDLKLQRLNVRRSLNGA